MTEGADRLTSDETKPRTRKLAIFDVTPEVLIALFSKNKNKVQLQVIANALPADARVYGVGGRRSWDFNIDRGVISVIIASESFEEIPEGNTLPILPCPLIKTIQRTKYNPFVCLECGGQLEDRRGLDRTEGYLICEAPECATRIPAHAWKDLD